MAINFKKLGTLPTANSISDDDFLVVVRAANNAIPRDVKVPKSLIAAGGASSEPVSLLDLTDVTAAPGGEPVDGQTLVYEAESGDYVTTKLNLDQLGDVQITNKLAGDVLTWDNVQGKWVNAQPASAPTDGSGGSVGTSGVSTINEMTGDAFLNTAIPLILQKGSALLEPETIFATHMPFRFRLSPNLISVRASLATPSALGDLQFNILVNGTALSSTPFFIPSGLTSSNEAEQPLPLLDTIPEDARIEVEIVSVGVEQSGAGLSVWLVGYETAFF